MESEIAKILIATGDKTFIWVGVGIFIIQLVFIPAVVFLFKYFSSQSKSLTDAERQITKMERDAQMAGFQKQLDEHILQDNHKQEETNHILETMNKLLNEFCNQTNDNFKELNDKFQKMYEKVHNIR